MRPLPRNTRIKEAVASCLHEARCVVSPECLDALSLYFSLLSQWNERINLTGLKGVEEMVAKHLGDTLPLLSFIPEGHLKVLDVGTGAGVPGLILKLLRPSVEMWLVDAVRKKVSFLRFVVAQLSLKGTHPLHLRLGPDTDPSLFPEGGFDLVVSQAMTSASGLAAIVSPFLKREGRVIAMKGRYGDADRGRDDMVLKELGMESRVISLGISKGGKERSLVIISFVLD